MVWRAPCSAAVGGNGRRRHQPHLLVRTLLVVHVRRLVVCVCLLKFVCVCVAVCKALGSFAVLCMFVYFVSLCMWGGQRAAVLCLSLSFCLCLCVCVFFLVSLPLFLSLSFPVSVSFSASVRACLPLCFCRYVSLRLSLSVSPFVSLQSRCPLRFRAFGTFMSCLCTVRLLTFRFGCVLPVAVGFG